MKKTDKKQLFLVGNPNVGKSVLFGHLTGAYTTVSNYPGTTVALSKGEAVIEGEKYQVVDTPGINSLVPMSEDEAVTRDLLLDHEGVVLQVADAKNLHRALPITFQLQEMKIPFILVINMCDEAAKAGVMVNAKKLESLLGVPVVQTVAVRGIGMAQMKEKLKKAKVSDVSPSYTPAIEQAVQRVTAVLPEQTKAKRALATMLLAGDRHMAERLRVLLSENSKKVIENVSRELAGEFAEPINFLMSRDRKTYAGILLKQVTTSEQKRRPLWGWLSKATMHPVGGILVLACILELVYLFVGKFGAGTAVDYFENTLFGQYISPGAIWLFDHIFSFAHTHQVEKGVAVGSYLLNGDANVILKFLHDAFVGPYGLITMGVSYGFAIVLPIVTTFFIAFSIMEDSGYLPRLAVMVNRIFKWIGLNGKAVLPMVLGLGCDTMATLTTRILETRKQRIIVTLLLALAVPCSAQLGILLGMFGTMPVWTFWVWMSLITGIVFFVGFISSKIIPGEESDFIMEIPPLRLPQLRNVAKKTLSRLEWYVKEAIPLFLLGTFILFLLDAAHLLGWIQKGLSPLVVTLLGLPQEAANAFLIGFLRRDYGATGFFDMYSRGQLTVVQALVGLTVITLFVPCVANVFMMIKETGGKATARMVLFIFPFAFLVGGILNWIL